MLRLLLACGWWLVIGLAVHAADSQKPNIIMIVGDDMGYADIGVHGCKDIRTPHIDSLAKNGVRCTSGYVSGPYCSPTRAGLLTGRYQTRFGHEFNPGPTPDAEIGLSLKEVTLADKLKQAGYATGMVGKWHLGADRKFHPLQRGFNEYFGFLGGAHSYFASGNNAKGRAAGILRGYEPVDEKEYLTDAFAREAEAFIDRHQKEPFFLYLTFNAVHTPMEANDKYLERFKHVTDKRRQTYCAMMSALDDAVGRVLGKLTALKLSQNTLVMFISDNGGPTGANGSLNTPLHGDKATTWEGGIRVPFMAQWPAKLPAGKVYDQPVIQLDLHATALAAAGATSSRPIEGVNLLPHFTGEKSAAPHESLYWRFGQQWAIRHGSMKLVETKQTQHPMLFDLASDIGESRDLSADKPEIVKDLRAKWEAWDKENQPATWGQQKAAQNKKAKNKKAT